MMHSLFRSGRQALMVGAMLGIVALVGLQNARAGVLTITISEGGTSFTILDNGPLDNQPATNLIQANAPALVFPDFTVVGLNASTNNPGAANPAGAVLTVGGEIQRTTSGAAATLVVTVTDTDFSQPTGARALTSTGSATFTNVASGDTSAFTSWFNANNTANAKQTSSGALTFTSTGIGLNSGSGTTTPVSASTTTPYGLTNETRITLSGMTGSATPDVVFGGSTKILGTVPEPTSVSMLLMALPWTVLWMRRRRVAA